MQDLLFLKYIYRVMDFHLKSVNAQYLHITHQVTLEEHERVVETPTQELEEEQQFLAREVRESKAAIKVLDKLIKDAEGKNSNGTEKINY